MGSPPCPWKGGSAVQLEHIEQLLRHGAVLTAPGAEMFSAAGHLEQLGLIRAHAAEFVRCSEPEDADFSRTNRHCGGRIYVDGPVQDLRCPECERLVYPDEDQKRRAVELRTHVLPSGVCQYVEQHLRKMAGGFRSLADGVYQVPLGTMGVVVCVVDYCAEPRFITRQWASTHPTCYLGVDAQSLDERFVDEPWLCRIRLADILAGDVDLATALHDLACSNGPVTLQHISMPVYSRGPLPLPLAPRPAPPTERSFVVEMRPEGVFVEGVLVVPANSGARFQVFSVLWDRFLVDLRDAAGRFEAQNVEAIMSALQSRTGRQLVDEVTVRRAVNRLQSDIGRNLNRHRGLPVRREDVVQTCRWQGQGSELHGYRLNPRTVMVRPAQTEHRAAP
jgi:hypothetical protein